MVGKLLPICYLICGGYVSFVTPVKASENLQFIIQRSFGRPVLAVFDSNPNETSSLRDDPTGKGDPCTTLLGPLLHVEEFSKCQY